MSIRDGKDYLYLIWKCDSTRRQYIVGQLTKNGQYEFEYCGDIKDAIAAGFAPLISFENLEQRYKSDELFPSFASRLPDKKRKDIDRILKKYSLDEYDAYLLLKRSGAKLPIDNLQFIDPIMNFENDFEKRFYLAGSRHYLGCKGNECSEAVQVTRGDEVFLEQEPDNSHDDSAIKVVNEQRKLLGYIPRYYCRAFLRFMEEERGIICHIANADMNKCCDECILIAVKVSKKL